MEFVAKQFEPLKNKLRMPLGTKTKDSGRKTNELTNVEQMFRRGSTRKLDVALGVATRFYYHLYHQPDNPSCAPCVLS